jgi:NTE family protein
MERSGRLLPCEGHLGETLSIMLPTDQKKDHCVERRPPFECTALLLHGALGAYQAGVYEALSEAGIHPDWVAGISIGAVNSAIIAGNPPEKRLEGLRRFWERITSDAFGSWAQDFLTPLMKGDWVRGLMNQVSANSAMLSGAPGFFVPRLPSPWLHPRGSIEATSFYDASGLRNTLESLVDFDRINAREMRFSVGAVNVRSGNFVYFDSTTHTIRPEHVMASGALPPGLAAVEIDGERYWDGGLISNTPLQRGAGQHSASGHAGFPSRSMERPGRFSRQHGRSRNATKRDPIFEPYPSQHGPVQARAANTQHRRRLD